MKGKKYSSREKASGRQEPTVKERGSGQYARQKSRKSSPGIGISLTEASRKIRRPVTRSEKDIEWALGIAGIGEGPEDLSQNMRVYLGLGDE